MKFLVQVALLVFIACICDYSQAINCYSRGGDSSINNGAVVSCTDAGYNYCYAYSVNTVNFAGCSSSDICSAGTFTDCRMCNTSYCNSMTPSRISCYSRSGSPGSNGTRTTCHSGVLTCYTFGTSYSNTAGCGKCSITDPTCRTCGTNYCNSWTPSGLSCYYSPSSSSDGRIRSCATGYSTCYSYQSFPSSSGSYYGGCGSCNLTANPSCVTCSTNLCNRRFPSAISCYQRYKYIASDGFISNGMPVSCSTGIATCYLFTAFSSFSAPYSIAGCGTCDPDTVPSCTTCSTGFCNTVAPSSASCYHRGSPTDSQRRLSCYSRIKSCFSLKKEMGSLSDNIHIGVSGCGVCTARTASLFGCTCSTTNCFIGNFTTTRASSTDPRTAQPATTLASRTDPRTAQPATTLASSTDPRTAQPATTLASSTDPRTAQPATTLAPRTDPRTAQPATTLASSTDPRTAQPATTLAPRTDPRTAHPATTLAPRTGPRTAQPATTLAPRTGPRTAQPATVSTTFSTIQHTTTNPGIRCYYSVAENQHRVRKRVLCSLSNSCYEYSFGYAGATFFFAGCGDCPFDVKDSNQQVVVEDSNCRTCKTNYCNSAGSPVQSGFAMLVLGAYVALLQMLHP